MMMMRASGGVVESALPNGVVCPKPRRVCGFSDFDAIQPIRPSCLLQFSSQQMEACDSEAATELLDIILTKGDYGDGRSDFLMDSSTPFFCGSPPSRASNPLIQDAHFGHERFVPFAVAPPPSSPPPPPSPLSSCSARKSGGGCGMKFGHKPAPPVRIEGFNCRRNCSISAVA